MVFESDWRDIFEFWRLWVGTVIMQQYLYSTIKELFPGVGVEML
jgi:hypothetical protein